MADRLKGKILRRKDRRSKAAHRNIQRGKTDRQKKRVKDERQILLTEEKKVREERQTDRSIENKGRKTDAHGRQTDRWKYLKKARQIDIRK